MHVRDQKRLPHLLQKPLLTDGGLETTLIFHEGWDLPYFAAFDLLRTDKGRSALRAYYKRYAQMATDQGRGFILDSPTWRASKDWGDRLGYSEAELAEANRAAIKMMSDIRKQFGSPDFIISGNIGPRGDGYVAGKQMSISEADAYHEAQVVTFANTVADLISAVTLNYVEEAIGVVNAAVRHKMPVVISFTVETDGTLPSGQSLGDAIEQVDERTGSAPEYFMINCAHPDHFRDAVARGKGWIERVHGVRANASRMSHAELDNSEVLDDGDPIELGNQYRELRDLLPNLVVLGGCCGTDHRHVEAISHAFHGHP